MSDRQPPIDAAHARELLRRERIESSLADLKQVRESELEEIDTEINPLEDGTYGFSVESGEADPRGAPRDDSLGRAHR